MRVEPLVEHFERALRAWLSPRCDCGEPLTLIGGAEFRFDCEHR